MTDVYYCSTGVPLLVRDDTNTATMIIRGRELKQLTGFHVGDFIHYYKDVSKFVKLIRQNNYQLQGQI